jgi:hypothetical protein
MKSSSRIDHAAPSAVAKALGLGPREWGDLAVAIAELAVARIRLAAYDRSALIAAVPAASRASESGARAKRVRLAIARVSHRLPWRTDCLVQALAAQHWLRRHGFESSLRIGVPRKSCEPFEAHAWLMHGDEVVTGGNVEDHVALFDSASLRAGRSSRS